MSGPSLNDKRLPDAPRTIGEALSDAQQLLQLLPEMAEDTVIQTLIKSGVVMQIFQAHFWAHHQGITLDEVNDYIDDQEEIMEQVESLRGAGLPEDMTFANADQTIENFQKQGKLQNTQFDLAKAKALVAKVKSKQAELEQAPKAASLPPPNPNLKNPCAGCHQKEGLNRCGRCKVQSYCSVVCQKQDWAKHKANCTPAAN